MAADPGSRNQALATASDGVMGGGGGRCGRGVREHCLTTIFEAFGEGDAISEGVGLGGQERAHQRPKVTLPDHDSRLGVWG